MIFLSSLPTIPFTCKLYPFMLKAPICVTKKQILRSLFTFVHIIETHLRRRKIKDSRFNFLLGQGSDSLQSFCIPP